MKVTFDASFLAMCQLSHKYYGSQQQKCTIFINHIILCDYTTLRHKSVWYLVDTGHIWDTGCRMDKLSLSVTFFFFFGWIVRPQFSTNCLPVKSLDSKLVLNSIIFMCQPWEKNQGANFSVFLVKNKKCEKSA